MFDPKPQLNPPWPVSSLIAQILKDCPAPSIPPNPQSWLPFSERSIHPPRSTSVDPWLRMSTNSSRLLTLVMTTGPGAAGGGGSVGGGGAGGSVGTAGGGVVG